MQPERNLTPVQDIRNAFGLLTRLPVSAGSPAGSCWAWPLVGVTVGGIAAISGTLLMDVGLPAGFAAAIVLAVAALLTGALHEDGLADTADGFWGGRTAERRLEIMKDSRIGSYGALTLILSLMAKWSLLVSLLTQGEALFAVMVAGALSRMIMPGLMAALPFARNGGLAASIGRPSGAQALSAVTLGLVISAGLCGFVGLMAALAAVIATVLLGLMARARIGGQTGDVLGASQQLAEISALAVLVAAL